MRHLQKVKRFYEVHLIDKNPEKTVEFEKLPYEAIEAAFDLYDAYEIEERKFRGCKKCERKRLYKPCKHCGKEPEPVKECVKCHHVGYVNRKGFCWMCRNRRAK